jgi:hypothetical protein
MRRIGLLLMLVGCEAARTEQDACPVGVYETTWSEPETDCPPLPASIAFNGADPVSSPLGGRCTGQRLASQCKGSWDLTCERLGQTYTFVGSLRFDGAQSARRDGLSRPGTTRVISGAY